MSKQKAIVIGAGIGGLITALCLKQQGFSVTIYEKAKTITNIGGGLLIFPNGIRILKLLGLNNSLEELDGALKHLIAYDKDHNLLLHDSLNEFYAQTDNYIAALSRTDLQMTLVEMLSDIIHTQHECVHIKEYLDKVYVTFENGIEDSADIVVGADGINSIARKMINELDEELNYRGICAWGGILSGKECINTPNKSLSLISGVDRFGSIASLNNQRQMWIILARMEATDLIRSEDKLSQLRLLCNNWSPQIDNILKASQNVHNFAVTVHEVSPMANWVKGRVALIGDAAHGFGPVHGLGTSVAIEDAFILTKCISQYNHCISDGLQEYQKIRRPIINQFRELEHKEQKLKLTQNEKILSKINSMYASLPAERLFSSVTPLINNDFFQHQLDGINLQQSSLIKD